MIHIVFGASASGSVKWVLREMGLDNTEEVIAFHDTFSIGPIHKLHEEIGIQARFDWMKESMTDEFGDLMDDQKYFETAVGQLASIQDGSQLTVWCSDNAHELTGLRYVSHLLKGRNCDIAIISTSEAYEMLFCMKKQTYTPLHTGEIAPEKLQVIFRQGSRMILTDDDREELEKEWIALSESKEVIRVWRDGTLRNVSEDYHDEFIIQQAKKLHRQQSKQDYMKSARLIGEVIGHLDQYTGDEFIEYRLRKLIEKNVFEMEGSIKAMRYYSIKLR